MCSKNLISLATRTRRHIIVRLAVVISAAFAFTLPLRAADVISTRNAVSGNWGVNGSWTNVPAMGGFPNNGNGGVATYDAVLSNGSTITLDQNIVIQKFTLSSGTVTGSFNLTLNDNLFWTGGTMGGTGTTSVAGASSTISGGSLKGLDRTLNNSGTITDSMTDGVSSFGFGLVSGATPAVLNNSGTFNTTAGGDFSVNFGNAGDAINNSGTWNVSGAGFTSNVNSGITFNNTGAVNVTSGTFALGGGGTSTGTFVTSSGATLNFTAAYLLDNGTAFTGIGFAGVTASTVTAGNDATDVITAETFSISGGTLNGLGALNIDNLIWTGGTMGGTGTTSVAGASSTISGDSLKGLDRTLNNSGTITDSMTDGVSSFGFGLVSGATPAVLNNSGTFNTTAGGDFSVNFGNAGDAINNSGTWNVSGAGFTSNVNSGITFNNTGAVNVTSGTFALGGGGTSTGTFVTSSGATLNFVGGTHNLNAGSGVSGAGTVQFGGGIWNFNAGTYNVAGTTSINGGTANFNSAASTNALALSAGTLSGTALLSASGDLTWTGGTMSGTGTTSVAGASSTISGGSLKGLDRTLNNSGTITDSMIDSGTPFAFNLVDSATPGVLNNSGTFNTTAGGDFSVNFGNAGDAINNSGTWNVSGAGFTSNVNSGITFNNTGAVNVTSGTFALGGGGTSTGTFVTSSGATLNFVGGTHNLNAGSGVSGAGTVQFGGGIWNFNAGTYNVAGTTSINGGTANFNSAASTNALALSAGTLSGTALLSASGDLTWTGGTMSGTGTTSVAGASSTISGGGLKGLDRTLNNSGTITDSMIDSGTPFAFNLVDSATPGVLNNSGTFNTTAGGDFSVNFGNAGDAINNSGTWNVSGAGFTSNVNSGITFNNTATVNVNSGTFSLTSATVTQYSGTSLTAGIWRVFANSVLNLPTTGTGIVTNQADITLSGAGSAFGAGASGATLESKLTTNSGALRVLAGRNFTATSAVSSSGVLQLGGGTFTGPGLTNSGTGELFGFGTVTPRPTNSGLIRSSGGTLAFANGIQGGSGTVQIDAGSVLNLSGGSSASSADFLIHNGDTVGSLNLGTNNFTATVDYTNASYGVGNSFNPRANVTGTGGILAFGGTGQTLIGNVTNGGTATPAMTFGNVHVGSTNTLNYQINNTGASGSRLRGALQTTVNGGNITDPKLSGSGVTAGNFGPVNPSASTGSLSVVYTPNTVGVLSGQTVRVLNNFDNVGDQTLSITGTAWRLAAASAHTPEPINFGNVHVGAAPSQALTISNTAATDGFSEGLNGSLGGTSGGVTTNGGSFTLLAPGASNNSALAVGINAATAGIKNGTATINLTSDGTGSSGLGTTALAAQTVNVTGSVYRLAAASAHTPEPINVGNFHVGDTPPSQGLSLTNTAANDNFSEALNASIGSPTGGVTTNSGSFNLLGPGSSNTGALAVGINTASTGSKNGTATITLTSDGTGSSGLGTTALTAQTVNVTGSVYRLAAASAHTPEPINFGNFHVGDAPPSQGLSLTNNAANDNFSEALNANIGSPTGGVTTNGGSFTLLAPGASSNSALSVGISTASVGLKNGTATIGLTSDGTGSSGLGTTALTAQTVNVTGSVYRLAQAALPAGTVIDFSIVHVGETVQNHITVDNAAPADGFSEGLDGSFSGSTGDVTGAGSFVGLAAGGSSNAPIVTLNTTTTGAKSGTATLAFTSNGAGTSGLASTSLPSQVLTATGQVNNFAAPQFLLDGGAATLTGSGTAYMLDFGTRTSFGALPTARLKVRNAAAAPADTMAGSFTPNAPHYNLSGFKKFTGITAGQDFAPLVVTPTDTLGEFSETITFNGRSQNGSGFDGPLAPVTITLHGIVTAAPALRIVPSGADVVVSWPVAEENWVLKRSADLENWTDVDQPTIDTALEHTVRVPRGAETKLFFRLEK